LSGKPTNSTLASTPIGALADAIEAPARRAGRKPQSNIRKLCCAPFTLEENFSRTAGVICPLAGNRGRLLSFSRTRSAFFYFACCGGLKSANEFGIRVPAIGGLMP
jgi:hypothetical protein